MIEGLEIADYVTLYDHSDQYLKYKFKRHDAAPLNRFDFHSWRIFLTPHSHWREAPSTTMTFAARVKTLKEDYNLWMSNSDKSPWDFLSFIRLTKQRSISDIFKMAPNLRMRKITLAMVLNNFAWFRKKRLLISALPGKSTHSERSWLSPLTDWTKV